MKRVLTVIFTILFAGTSDLCSVPGGSRYPGASLEEVIFTGTE